MFRHTHREGERLTEILCQFLLPGYTMALKIQQKALTAVLLKQLGKLFQNQFGVVAVHWCAVVKNQHCARGQDRRQIGKSFSPGRKMAGQIRAFFRKRISCHFRGCLGKISR